jgi:hypothetical protein
MSCIHSGIVWKKIESAMVMDRDEYIEKFIAGSRTERAALRLLFPELAAEADSIAEERELKAESLRFLERVADERQARDEERERERLAREEERERELEREREVLAAAREASQKKILVTGDASDGVRFKRCRDGRDARIEARAWGSLKGQALFVPDDIQVNVVKDGGGQQCVTFEYK